MWFHISHRKHHKVTVHHGYDGEVVLPQYLNFKDWRLWLSLLAWNPLNTWRMIIVYGRRAAGKLDGQEIGASSLAVTAIWMRRPAY